jgi:hypothetical protein
VSFVFTIWKVIKTEQTYLHFVITVWFNRVEREQKQSADVNAITVCGSIVYVLNNAVINIEI